MGQDNAVNSAAESPKAEAELVKLREEIVRLQSENSIWGRATRTIWPLVSGALTVAVSLVALSVSYQSQSAGTAGERRRAFQSALQMATDIKAGQDARIAGVWSLSSFWHDLEHSEIAANALAAILISDPDSSDPAVESKAQRLRQSAATVIGSAIDKKTSSSEATRLRILLYGDGPTGTIGAVNRPQQSLAALKRSLETSSEPGPNPASDGIEMRLRATREAIRLNWENLEFAMFADHDLTGINAYEIEARGAFFGGSRLHFANLCGAKLRQANFIGADLSFAELSGADLSSTYNWENVNLKGANIRNVKNAPPEFYAAAKRTDALDLPHASWLSLMKMHVGTPPPTAVYTSCELLGATPR